MIKTKTIYKVVGKNNFGTIEFEVNTIDCEYAFMLLRELSECVDVQTAYMTDATTGEVIADYQK